MGLFSKRAPATKPAPAQSRRLGPGRRLQSGNDPAASARSLTAALNQHAPPRYEHMPALHPARVTWHGDSPGPAEAWFCNYGDNGFVIALWPAGARTTIGLFPRGGGEEALGTPLIGNWKMEDRSLTSLGRFDAGLLTLHAPRLPADYFDDILSAAGFPATAHNRDVLVRQLTDMFLLKAYEYLSKLHSERAADRFVEQHRWAGDEGLAQRILDDLAAFDSDVVPYIQDLPGRIRGIVLGFGPGTPNEAGLWTLMHR